MQTSVYKCRISFFDFLGFEEQDGYWIWAKKEEMRYRERAESLRDELSITYEKNRVKIRKYRLRNVHFRLIENTQPLQHSGCTANSSQS